MLGNPEISVIMSVYNSERFLNQAINSILDQTFSEFEFVIVNDASTDNSRNIILSYTDSRIKLIDNDTNIGLTKSLNKAIEIAKGRYIARMDADDISLPDRFSVQYDFLEANNDFTLVGSGAYLINENNNEIGSLNRPFTNEIIIGHAFFYNPIIHPVVMFRKNTIVEIGAYNIAIKRAQDYDLWLRLIKHGAKICNLPQLLLQHREHDNSIESAYPGEQQRYAAQALHDALIIIFSLNVSIKNIELYRKLCYSKPKLPFSSKYYLLIFLYRFRNKFHYLYNNDASINVFDYHINAIIENIGFNSKLEKIIKLFFQ